MAGDERIRKGTARRAPLPAEVDARTALHLPPICKEYCRLNRLSACCSCPPITLGRAVGGAVENHVLYTEARRLRNEIQIDSSITLVALDSDQSKDTVVDLPSRAYT